MMEYVAGMMFDIHGKYIAMVEKNRPAWQAGRYNAIGGKIEEGESPIDAMIREFAEETGVSYPNWRPTAELSGKDFKLYFYHCFTDLVWDCETIEDERIFVDSVQSVLHSVKLMPNLSVIIPLALDQSGIQKPVILRDES